MLGGGGGGTITVNAYERQAGGFRIEGETYHPGQVGARSSESSTN